MGIRFVGNGIGTSSIAFTTVNLRAPAVPDSSPNIIDQTEILVSDAGIRSSYKSGQRQLEYNFRLPILNTTEYEDLLEFIEKIDGANNWFTLQDHLIPKKDNINCQILADDDTVYNSTDLIASLWPEKPIGKWVLATSGANNNLRRRIIEYQSGGPSVIVSPAFPNLFNIITPDTFIIGVPVILASKEIRRQARAVNFWDIQLSFVEKGD